MNSQITKLRWVIAFLCAVPASAQDGPRWDIPPAARAVAGITLNQDSLAGVRAKLGPAQPWTGGAHHDELTSVCYVLGSGAGGQTLVVATDVSVMGLSHQPVNVIALRAGAQPNVDGHACTPVATPWTDGAGLRLGMARREVHALLGAPHRTAGDSIVYVLSDREPMRPGTPEYERWNTPERRRSCFDGGPPFAWVGGSVTVHMRADAVAAVRLERYNGAVC